MTQNEQDETEQLIKKAQSGDGDAFSALVESYYETMFKMAYKWCGNKSEAEDVTQESCIKLARALNSFTFKAAFTSWLYRLVINTAIDGRRKYKKEILSGESGHLGTSSAEPQRQDDILQAKEVMRQVMALPDKEKTALLLVAGDGMNHAEAAYVMGCKESTVSWYIHEARKKLSRQNPAIFANKKERPDG